MELYFEKLISKGATLEKLVDDLTLVVQGADDYARAVGEQLSEESRTRLVGRLEELKQACVRLRSQAVSGARATDRLLRANPYASVSLAFAAGLLSGYLCARSYRK